MRDLPFARLEIAGQVGFAVNGRKVSFAFEIADCAFAALGEVPLTKVQIGARVLATKGKRKEESVEVLVFEERQATLLFSLVWLFV